ncbi:MAG: Lrp/AsnC family transcriptional regulator [Hadesarchaea archaeon]|nr:Lrp/AsnC family transcriptional regulator [Hadesarchaea archaeon]
MKELDKKIIEQLIKDAKQPIVDIADQVGASRQTVSKKIKKLRESGLIESQIIRLNPEKFGLNTRAYVFLRELPQDEAREKNEEFISDFPQVYNFRRLFGRYSAIIEVLTESREELTSIVKEIHSLEGVRETETFIVHSTIKDKPKEPFLNILKSEDKS